MKSLGSMATGLTVGLAMALAATAAPLPYDAAADAHLALEQALAAAGAAHENVLVIFGANWCQDCRDLDRAMQGSSAALLDSRFIVVKIDVGNFDRNRDLTQRFGNPTAMGIPAAVVLTADGQLLYATRGGELANARRMGERGIYAFFSKVLPVPPSS